MKAKLERGFRALVVLNKNHSRQGSMDELAFMVLDTLKRMGVSDLRYREQPSRANSLKKMMLGYCDEGLDLMLLLGGSANSLGPRVVKTLVERELAWVPKIVLLEGSPLQRASMGCTVVGARKKTLLAAVPGSLENLNQALKDLAPYLLDAFLDVLSPDPLAQAA